MSKFGWQLSESAGKYANIKIILDHQDGTNLTKLKFLVTISPLTWSSYFTNQVSIATHNLIRFTPNNHATEWTGQSEDVNYYTKMLIEELFLFLQIINTKKL